MVVDAMPTVSAARAALRDLLRRARDRARAADRPVLASLVAPAPPLDPLAAFGGAAALAAERVYWERPAEGLALVGVGAAWEIAPSGAGRFAEARRAWEDVNLDVLVENASAGHPAAGPLLLGGFAFDPARPATGRWRGFPDALLTLPRLLLTRDGDGAWLTLTAVVRPESDPESLETALLAEGDALLAGAEARWASTGEVAGLEVEEPLPAAAWRALVAEAAGAVRAGALEKVVLAREARLRAARPFDVARALERLRAGYPTCYVFAVARGERVILGATPERLARLREGRVEAACLAGSIRRGATPEEDGRLGHALLASAKDRAEHAVVVRALAAALEPLCSGLDVPAAPTLLSVSNVHHLYTPLSGRVREGVTLLDLVERAHPTPAVGGWPREAALRFIREREGLDRGWYAGPVGWLDRRGEGEFAVALRSALVWGREASLFAGCGIVGDSDPAQEYGESALKLRPMLGALGEGCR